MIKKTHIQKYSVIAADIIAVFISYYWATQFTNFYHGTSYHQLNLHHWPWLKALDLLMLIMLMWHRQLYFKRRPNWEDLRLTYRALITLFLINLPILFIKNNHGNANTLFIFFWSSLFLTIPIIRSSIKLGLSYLRLWQRNVYIVGVNEEAFAAYKLLQPSRLLGYDVKALVDLKFQTRSVKIGNSELPIIDIHQLFTKPKDSEIVLCLSNKSLAAHTKLINHLQQYFLSVVIIPEIKGLPLYGIEVNPFFGNEQILMRLENNLSSRFNRFIKYCFDLILAIIVFPVFAVILILVSFLIYIEDKNKPIFSQIRVGADGKLFKCFKFRTMSVDAEAIMKKWQTENHPIYQEYVLNNFKLKNDPRITKIGKFLRKTSLDELPQVLNVFLGQMSMVGPRPLIPSEIKDYHEGLFYYQQVRPGITGLWQISGRSETSFADRCRLDTWYVRNWTLWADVVILIKTFQTLVLRHGAY
ncbi:undecaprenyl-phosphate galactose phosphotransferase WbaP [Aquella oligotrophica]|uniref:Bacterial sugar transferase domain-containing protein n=1 Tax=Aquella oligotrophica TaxID=2067065 RepID=A0A2I7N596_9NEIS|nr:undecaprenyl-phosphate galactose phosphotransferase WbaP [Aquella oligotrophica]AUR51601.1 hypothetical protein CUN60_04615 [Aquella oligotrophica]